MDNLGQLALIALGSNGFSVWGDPRETVQKAMGLLAQISCSIPAYSDIFQTPAFPAGAGPDFVNAAMRINTRLSPDALLAELHKIELTAGRVRNRRWGPRSLDIDLLAVADLVRPDRQSQTLWRDLPLADQQRDAPDQLILPHPRVQDRAFVLVPMAQIAPDWIHPVLGQTVVEMLAACPLEDRDAVQRLG